MVLKGIEATLLSMKEIEAFDSLIHMYSQNIAPNLSDNLGPLHRLRELLICWSATCFIHASAKKEHPLLECLSLLLPWIYLKHLLLDEKYLLDSLAAIIVYLDIQTMVQFFVTW